MSPLHAKEAVCVWAPCLPLSMWNAGVGVIICSSGYSRAQVLLTAALWRSGTAQDHFSKADNSCQRYSTAHKQQWRSQSASLGKYFTSVEQTLI